MFWAEIREIMYTPYTPVNPSFTMLKWGLRGSNYISMFSWSMCFKTIRFHNLWNKLNLTCKMRIFYYIWNPPPYPPPPPHPLQWTDTLSGGNSVKCFRLPSEKGSHHENMPIYMKYWFPSTPVLFSKTEIYRDIYYFFLFLCFEQKCEKYQCFLSENFQFLR